MHSPIWQILLCPMPLKHTYNKEHKDSTVVLSEQIMKHSPLSSTGQKLQRLQMLHQINSTSKTSLHERLFSLSLKRIVKLGVRSSLFLALINIYIHLPSQKQHIVAMDLRMFKISVVDQLSLLRFHLTQYVCSKNWIKWNGRPRQHAQLVC